LAAIILCLKLVWHGGIDIELILTSLILFTKISLINGIKLTVFHSETSSILEVIVIKACSILLVVITILEKAISISSIVVLTKLVLLCEC